MGLQAQTIEYRDNSGGLDLRSSPTKVAEDAATLSLNMDYQTDGAFGTRYGSTILNVSAGIPAQMSGAPTTLAYYDYLNSDGTEVTIVCTSDGKIKHGITNPTDVVTGLTADTFPDMEFIVTENQELLIWGNGVDTNLKFDGTNWTNLSLPRPTAPTAADLAVGTLSAGDYQYYVSYAVTSGGVIIQESELSPISNTVTIAANRQIRVTIPTCTETLATGVTAQCNARVIYRVSPSSSGIAYRCTTITDNVTTTYDDNTAADGTIEADFDLQATPDSAIFELDDYGQMWFRDEDKKTDLVVSTAYKPWATPTANRIIFDSKINCVRRCYGTLVIGTDVSLWVQNGSYDTASPRRFCTGFGILNNRCAGGETDLYIVSTNKNFYRISPTDFSQDQMRTDEPLSYPIESLFNQINDAALDQVCMEHYTNASVAKILISAPFSLTTNDKIIVYNETQSRLKKKPIWHLWDNIKAATMRQMTVSGTIGLYSGDYNGFLWKLDDSSTHGDGAEENGTVTSATTTVITDSTKSFTVNELVGKVYRTISGTGEDLSSVVTANTATTITVSPALTTAPDTTSTYTVGGYDAYHFTNWKKCNGSYDQLKQLWYILANANANGDYPVRLIIQADFNQNTQNQASININLAAANTIWGSFIWGAAPWGTQSVFQSLYRFFSRFRSIRLGFMNREAGQPFQFNAFSISAQNKGMFYRGIP